MDVLATLTDRCQMGWGVVLGGPALPVAVHHKWSGVGRHGLFLQHCASVAMALLVNEKDFGAPVDLGCKLAGAKGRELQHLVG